MELSNSDVSELEIIPEANNLKVTIGRVGLTLLLGRVFWTRLFCNLLKIESHNKP